MTPCILSATPLIVCSVFVRLAKPCFSWFLCRQGPRSLFNAQAKLENHRIVFIEYFSNTSWCDPCAVGPLSRAERYFCLPSS